MKEFTKELQNNLLNMEQTGKLFVSSITGSQVWDLYIKNFTPELDPVFRDPNSTTHNCNTCNNFVRRYGNIVAVTPDNKIITLWDNITDDEFKHVANVISKQLKSATISNVFFETFAELNSLPYEKCNKSQTAFQLGTKSNFKQYTKDEAEKFGVVTEGQIIEFNHIWLSLNSKWVDNSGKSIEAIRGDYKSDKDVFLRGMEEICLDTLLLVRDLINQGSLLNGEAHLFKIELMIPLKEDFDKLPDSEKDNWAWVNSYKLNIAKFKNELIGVLCTELSSGVELNKAVVDWNKRVDPANYMKAVAPITKAQIALAQKFVEENGYADSFNRRFATLDDIKVTEIKHINNSKTKKAISIFDDIKVAPSKQADNKFDKVESVTIEKFMSDILPNCETVEAYLENRFDKNMVTLTTSNVEDSKPIFKWSNNYSKTYNGNLAGKSELREAVVSRGGSVSGVFRFSHSWNELEPNKSLMDLHVFMPGCEIPKQNTQGPHVTGRRVGWNNRTDVLSGGTQDVDYTSEAPAGYIPVENITFPDLNKMPEGTYTCKIHNWNFRKSGGKGKAEIEFGGQLFQYVYPATKNHEWITVAVVTLKNGVFTIEHHLPCESSTKEIYGLESNTFHKVNLVCLSPNYWGDNAVGNKHYLFMLEGAKTPVSLRGFHNEDLCDELLQHRKVLDVLGNSAMIAPNDNQLSGLGFNATVRDSLILKLSGNFKRTIKVTF